MNPALVATFQGVAESLLASLGAAVTYTGAGGAKTVPAIIEIAQGAIGTYGEILESSPIATLNRADISEPKRGDTLVYAGTTYTVDGVIADRSDAYIVVAALKVKTS